MVTKLRKINPISYRIGFSFFWNKAINNSILKFNIFLKLVYTFSYFFTVLFEKFFKFQIYKLNYFFRLNQLLFNFNLYSFNLIHFCLLNLYLPKLYLDRLNIINFDVLNEKSLLFKFLKLYKVKNKFFKKKVLIFAIQFSKIINLKISNNKLFNFFLSEFLYSILKIKISCTISDSLELLSNEKKKIINFFLSKNLQLYSKLKLKIKKSFFYFLIVTAWISLLQKNSFFFTKLITYSLKTRGQKFFLRFLRKFLIKFFITEVRPMRLKSSNYLRGIRIGLFGKLFGRRRSKKLYLRYYIKKTLLTSLKFKNINFTFLKSWTYYGAFGIKVWFFF